MTPKRVGLLGGAFNPPHLGHLKLAELACHELALDELRFVPSAQPPHKSLPNESPDEATRLGLLKAALLDLPWGIETLELDRPGPSYTVDTLEALAQRESGSAWILVMGSDQLAQFTAWKQWERLLELASVAAARRPGAEFLLSERLGNRQRAFWTGAPGEIVWLPSTELELSSSTIRAEIASGEQNEGLPIQVRAAIGRENLYR
ncbi:MAG: nicotinate (nicotinamide) nucleotide adenylyltransferase [Holophaga sp.]|nr:nicotinate (nicotinamide) nucleotide adenylyltransferase [Holophaga sp.]